MLKQKFLVQFGSNAILQAVGMLAGIVVARLAGPSVVGKVSYATAYVGLFTFVNGIFGPPYIKLASEGRDHGECLAIITRLSIITGVVYAVMTAGWFVFQKFVLRLPFESREIQIMIFVTLLANVLHKFEGFAQTVNTANLKQAKANLPTLIRMLFYHLGRVAVVILGGGALALSNWNLATTILTLPLVLVMLRGYKLGKFNKVLAREFWRFSFPIFVIVVVNSITHWADKLMLAQYTNTTELGYYSAANAIGGMFLLIAGPVGSIFFPLFSSMISKQDWAGVNLNIKKYQEFIVLFVLPLICAVAIAGGPLLLLVLGARYQPSINPFIVLVFSTYVVLWGLPYGNIIDGMGKFHVSAWINVIKLAIFLVTITALVSPRFFNLGATGVALNLLILNLASNGLNIFLAKKYGDVRINIKNYLRQAVILGLAVGGYFIAGLLQTQFQLWWLFFIPGYMALVYAALISLGLIKKVHWLMLWDALNFRKTINYVNDEIRGNT